MSGRNTRCCALRSHPVSFHSWNSGHACSKVRPNFRRRAHATLKVFAWHPPIPEIVPSIVAMYALALRATTSGESVAHIQEHEGGSSSRDLAVFSPDSRILALATGTREVKLWDMEKRQFLRTLGPHPWRVYAISFSPDGRHVASSSWEGDVRIFDVATGKEIVAPLYGHGSGVHGHCFSPDGTTLVSGGDDSTVRFWNVATGREMLVFFNAYNQLARLPFLSPTAELVVWRDFAQELRVRVESIPTMAEIEKAHRAESSAR